MDSGEFKLNPAEPLYVRAFPETPPGKHGDQLPKVIPLCLRIGACLRRLPTGESYSSFETSFQISKTILVDFCHKFRVVRSGVRLPEGILPSLSTILSRNGARSLRHTLTTLSCWYDIGVSLVFVVISLTQSRMDSSGVTSVTSLPCWSLHLS